MIKRKIVIGLGVLGMLLPMCSNATGQQIDWLPVTNCLGLASNMSSLLQNPSFIESQAIPFDETTVIEDGVLQDYSSSYFVDYNGKERLITILMGPKDPKGSTVDFKYAKKIGKIKLPVGFSNVRTRVYDNKYLIIFTEHYDYDRRIETVALVYDISDGKITPFYYFTHTGKLIKLHEQDGKLYVITNLPVDKNTIQSFIKKDGNLPKMFPKFVEGVRYGLDPHETVSVCRDYRYLQMPSNQMPSFWSVLVLNINNLKISKDILYLFGTISGFEFTEKSMYTTVPGDGGTTIVQKFGLDPKLNLQKSVMIDVPVLDGGIYAKDMRLAYIIKRASGKVNQYSLLPFDSTFSPSAEKTLYTSEETFSDVEFHSDSVVLKNRDKMVEIGELSNGGVSTHAGIELPLKNHNYYLFGSNPLTLIDLSTANSQLSFSVIAMDKAQGKFKTMSKAKYPGEGSLIGPTSRNAKTRTLLLPVKMGGETSFEGLKGLQFSTKGAVSEIMARSYGESTMVETVKQLQDYSFSVTDKLIDLFLPNNTISKKVFSRK